MSTRQLLWLGLQECLLQPIAFKLPTSYGGPPPEFKRTCHAGLFDRRSQYVTTPSSVPLTRLSDDGLQASAQMPAS